MATNPRLHIEFALMKLAFLLQQAPAAQTTAAAGNGARAHASDSGPRAIPLEGVQGVKASSFAEQTGGHGFPEQHSVTAPKEEAPKSEPAKADTVEAPAEQPSAKSELSQPAETVATLGSVRGRGPLPKEVGGVPRSGTSQQAGGSSAADAAPKRKKASSLSLSALMDEEEVEVMPAAAAQAAEEKPEALPEDGVLAGKWKELAAQFASQPRLANALSNANLTFREEDGRKVVAFTVTNEAQKKWIEERILRDLEGKFARLTGCGKLRLEPTVLPEEEQEKKIYMPSEKAEDLMSKNEEVRNLVVDLGLDIK